MATIPQSPPHLRSRAIRSGIPVAEGLASGWAGAIHHPFFFAGLAVILTVGAAWGVLLLFRISGSGSFTGVTVHEVNAHGHAQIMGWVGLFIMGVAYRVFPRLWQVALPGPPVAIVVWLAMLIGITARSTSMMFGESRWAAPLHAVGFGVETIAVSLFFGQLAIASARSDQRWTPHLGFVFAALAFFFLQTVYSGWHVTQLMQASGRDAMLDQIATFQAPLRDLQIHGLAMLMILGVGIRLFPPLFGLSQTPARRGWIALGVLLSAIALETSFFLAYRLTGWHAIAGALLVPWLMLPIGVGLIVGPWRLWQPMPQPGRTDRSGKFVRVAFGWLFASLAMLLLLPVYQMISGIPFSHAYYGAIRHAITVGFISMMIVGMAAKFAPRFSGTDPATLPSLWLPFALINLGCLFRVGFQVGTDWHPIFFQLVGLSGMLEWTGLAVWAVHLTAVMLGLGRYRHSSDASWGWASHRIEPD